MDRMPMNHTNFSCCSPSVVGYRYFAVLWGCAVTITGTVGNLMTILAFASDPRLRTRFNVLIINLAVADLLYCTIVQPISVDSYLHLRWRLGQLWCSIFGLLRFLSNSVSIITLCLVAVGRYLLVTKRTVFDRVFSDRGLILLLLSAWLLGLASFGPLWDVYVFVPKMCTCGFHRTKSRPFTTILVFFYVCLGLGCVGVPYLLIYRHVHIASRAILRHRPSHQSSKKRPTSVGRGTNDSGVESVMTNTHSGEISSQADSTQNEVISSNGPQSGQSPATSAANHTSAASPPHSRASKDCKQINHVTAMCFTVFLCFMLCFVPFMLLNIVDKCNRAPEVLYMLCTNLTWLNSCINPVLYAVMNRQFRQAYHLLLTRAAAPFTCRWMRKPALSH